MALSGNTVWEVRTTGNATNGGGFVTGASGTDWSQQDAAQYSVTDAVANGTTTVTSATASFGTDVVGNLAYIGGAWYQITARNSATSITVDRTISSASGLTLKIGGALSDVRVPLANMTSGNTVWIKSGTYTIGTGVAVDSSLQGFRVEGYGTTRGDLGTRPVIQATAAIIIWRYYVYGNPCLIRNIEFDGNSTGTVGLEPEGFAGAGSQTQISYCRFRRCTTAGLRVNNHGLHLYFCEFDGNQYGIEQNGAAYVDLHLFGCYLHDNTSHGVRRMTVHAIGCAFDSNGGYGIFGWGPHKTLAHCVFYNNTSGGFAAEDNSGLIGYAYNCIFYGNGGWGANGWKFFRACAFGSNTSGAKTGHTESLNEITLTADPFTNAAAGDFSLNNASGGGALLKGTGYPQSFPAV